MPISLIITLESVKFITAIFIANDTSTSDDGEAFALVQTSTLNEELGQISYVMTDKTGTLTCNRMLFKKLIVDGKPYGLKTNPQCIEKCPKVSNVDFSDPDFMQDLGNSKKM